MDKKILKQSESRVNTMKKTRWINFIGGQDLLFTLIILILLGIVVYIFNQLNFLFEPLILIVSNILMPSVIALLLYYLFNPLIDFMEKRKIKRVWGVAILYLVVIGLLVLLIGILIPLLQDQLMSFIDNFPDFLDNVISTVTGWINYLPFSEEIGGFLEQGEDLLTEIPDNMGQYLTDGFSGVSSVISGVTNVVMTIATFPIILFFLLKDDQRFFNAVLTIVPPKWREGLIRVSSEINSQVGAYVKGQLFIATSIGVMMFIGFTIIGLEYSGILAISAAFLSIIPYIGPTLAFLPALIVAFIDSFWMVIQLVIVWLIVQFIDGNFVEPNVMGKQLSIHPLTIIVVLLVMGDLMGLFGLIFGVPIYAILKVIIVHFFQQFKKRYNMYYGDLAGDYEVKPIEAAIGGDDQVDNQTKENKDEAKKDRKKGKEDSESTDED